MRKSKATRRRTGPDAYKTIKCMNHDPDNSKWAKYAPLDGPCTEVVEVPRETERVLCWRCTNRSATGK